MRVQRAWKPIGNVWRPLALVAVTGLVAAACGWGPDSSRVTTIATTAPTQAPSSAGGGPVVSGVRGLPPSDPLSVTGDIVVAGSSTVFPLAEAMAARFEDEGYSGLITVDSIGSGAGFERFCVAGESDVSNASRPIKDPEVEQCRAIGREPIEFRVGTDALAVVVSPGNTFATDLTVAELAVLFSTATTWQDVRAGFPANPIQ
ncbi:MAG: substrate-binding domain-containing protein, partial [bacterium]|nr:substrate-binding domain-containing protein [bacterium]